MAKALRASLVPTVLSGDYRTALAMSRQRSLEERVRIMAEGRANIVPVRLARALVAGRLLEPLHLAGLRAAGFAIGPGRTLASAGITGVTDAWCSGPLDGPVECKTPRSPAWSRDLPPWIMQMAAYRVAAGIGEGDALLSVLCRETLRHVIVAVPIGLDEIALVREAVGIWERIRDRDPEDVERGPDLLAQWVSELDPAGTVSRVEIDVFPEEDSA